MKRVKGATRTDWVSTSSRPSRVSRQSRAAFSHSLGLAGTFHECRHEAFETNVRRGFSQIRLALAYLQSVEEAPNVKRLAGERIERLALASMNYSNI